VDFILSDTLRLTIVVNGGQFDVRSICSSG
jgi:hypothetical protein